MDHGVVWMPELDCFLRYRISAGTWNFTSGKSDVYVLAAAATHVFTMVLFTAEPVSHRNTFVGGTCVPPSALLVVLKICLRQLHGLLKYFPKFFLRTSEN